MLLMCVMAVLLFIVMAVDLAQLSLQRRQMQFGADAATVAALETLMDRRWLYLGPEGTEPNDELLDALPGMQQLHAFEQAQSIAGGNRVANAPIELLEDFVSFGYIEHPGSGDKTVQQPTAVTASNTISISLTRSKLGNNPPILWMAKQTGLNSIDITVRSQASVATRIHGFQPLPRVNAPIVPLGLFEHCEEGAAPSHASEPPQALGDDLPSQLWWARGPYDHWIVDPRTGMVEPGHTHYSSSQDGSDGIAEMVFRLKVSDGPTPTGETAHPEARPSAVMGFRSEHLNDIDAFERMTTLGVHMEDLENYGGSITLGDENPALCPAKFAPTSDDLFAIHNALCHPDVLGRPRVWPVVADCSSITPGSSTVGIIGFVAGCVAHCEMDHSDGSLIITIQPCLLQTPTALTDGSTQRNPWIGKLLLVR